MEKQKPEEKNLKKTQKRGKKKYLEHKSPNDFCFLLYLRRMSSEPSGADDGGDAAMDRVQNFLSPPLATTEQTQKN